MTVASAPRLNAVEVIETYGKCLELVPIDPHFHNISIGLYFKGDIATVWTFSRREGVEARIEQVRDQLAKLGDMDAVEGIYNQVKPRCGTIHQRPLKFLMMQAVEKDPSFDYPKGLVKDLRSPLMLGFESEEIDGRTVYRVTAEGEAPRAAGRLRAITSGFVRYGEMERVGDGVSFSCGARHDQLMRLLLPYARNVTGTQDMLEADALRGQMTTGTLGFTPPT
jgi:hypothetical protein